MKRSRYQFEYRKNASRLHRAIGECLRNSPAFSGYQCYQEYPVSLVNPSFLDTSCHFDWVVLDLKLVIEGHGRQHEVVTDFSGKSEDLGISNFKAQKKRDQAKKQAAIEAGWTYIEFSWRDLDQITESSIIGALKSNKEQQEKQANGQVLGVLQPIQKLSKKREPTASEREYSERANQRRREYSKQQYAKARDIARSRKAAIKALQAERIDKDIPQDD